MVLLLHYGESIRHISSVGKQMSKDAAKLLGTFKQEQEKKNLL